MNPEVVPVVPRALAAAHYWSVCFSRVESVNCGFQPTTATGHLVADRYLDFLVLLYRNFGLQEILSLLISPVKLSWFRYFTFKNLSQSLMNF